MYVWRTVLTRRIGTFFLDPNLFARSKHRNNGLTFFLKWHRYFHTVVPYTYRDYPS
jgi:hypothetical protein